MLMEVRDEKAEEIRTLIRFSLMFGFSFRFPKLYFVLYSFVKSSGSLITGNLFKIVV